MNIFRNIAAVASLLAVSVLTTLIIAGSACVQQPTTVSADSSTSLDQSLDVVLATVNDSTITLGDLVSTPMYFVLLDQTLITPEVLRMKAADLGISVTPEEVQQRYNEAVEGAGGFDQLVANIPPSAPRSLLEEDIKKNVRQQLYIEKIMEIEFERQHGTSFTEEEIQDEFDMNSGMYQNMVANEPGSEVQPEDVTADMAVEQIKSNLKSRWISNNTQEYLRNLMDESNIQNYALDLIEEPEEVVVPPIGEGTFEMEPVEEEHGSEAGETVDEAPEGASQESGE
jgi:hypothetical protein